MFYMRKAWFLLLLAPSALVWACGSDDTNNADSGGNDATTSDVANNKDTGTTDTGTKDTGNGGDTGSQDAGNDVVVNVTCKHPVDCIDGGQADAAYPPDSGEVCCATVSLTGTFPQCSVQSLTTACTAPGQCASNIPFSCGTDTVRGCSHAAECTEQGYPKCCVLNIGDAAVQACLSPAVIQGTGAKCLDAGQ